MNKIGEKMSVLIMAAGMGSRFGGLKQLMPVGKNGELIIDYSIHDAIRLGFKRVVLIIRREHLADFQGIFDRRYSDRIAIEYAFQEMNDLPAGFASPAGREKPWGTGHAIWAARKIIKEPFIAINADDFYGTESYEITAQFLATARKNQFSIAGYQLANTLSDFGSVSRGVCATQKSAAGNLELVNVRELTKIRRNAGGVIYGENTSRRELLSADTLVSMNFFGFTDFLFAELEKVFVEFLQVNSNSPTAEFYIPFALDTLLKRGTISIAVLPTAAQWYGMTYREDHPAVATALSALADRYQIKIET